MALQSTESQCPMDTLPTHEKNNKGKKNKGDYQEDNFYSELLGKLMLVTSKRFDDLHKELEESEAHRRLILDQLNFYIKEVKRQDEEVRNISYNSYPRWFQQLGNFLFTRKKD